MQRHYSDFFTDGYDPRDGMYDYEDDDRDFYDNSDEIEFEEEADYAKHYFLQRKFDFDGDCAKYAKAYNLLKCTWSYHVRRGEAHYVIGRIAIIDLEESIDSILALGVGLYKPTEQGNVDATEEIRFSLIEDWVHANFVFDTDESYHLACDLVEAELIDPDDVQLFSAELLVRNVQNTRKDILSLPGSYLRRRLRKTED